jgi:carbon monoxide dehydrogenase subunit G
MEFSGCHRIEASPALVWESLNDPLLLRTCLPGCQRLERIGPTAFDAAIALRVGPIRATFRGRVHLTGQEPPLRCTLAGEAQGGAAGSAKGAAQVSLAPQEGGTELAYAVRTQLAGKLAEIGQGPVHDAARELADQFFARFAAALARGQNAPGPGQAVPARSPPARQEHVSPMIWMTGLAAVSLILVLLFSVVMQ